jgi:hypothetical protein
VKGALTLPRVRALVRLYRADVEGAAEQLQTLMQEQWDELHPLLQITPNDVVRMAEREDAVQTLARAVEDAAAGSSQSRSLVLRKAVRLAATALARNAVVRAGGVHHLPAKALRELLDLWRGSGDIAFGDRGVVDVIPLRALLRQCAGLDSTIITLTERELVIAYSTTRARGVIRLVLRARHDHDKVLVVPIPEVAAANVVDQAIYAPEPWPMDDAQGASSPQAPLPPRRPVLVLVR